MAHFVKLNAENVVIDCVVVNNDALDFNDEETSGVNFLNNLFGKVENWKQTSYNGTIRKQYAGIGFTYDVLKDIFIAPQPFASWILDDNFDWQPPKPRPDGSNWFWDEEQGEWINAETV